MQQLRNAVSKAIVGSTLTIYHRRGYVSTGSRLCDTGRNGGMAGVSCLILIAYLKSNKILLSKKGKKKKVQNSNSEE